MPQKQPPARIAVSVVALSIVVMGGESRSLRDTVDGDEGPEHAVAAIANNTRSVGLSVMASTA